ncbi:MAG: hypothetical protein WD069_05260 [Planctomycetales bacterium]
MKDVEYTLPLVLIGASAAVIVIYGIAMAGTLGAVAAMIGLGLQIVVGLVVYLPACFVTAYLLSTSFGNLGSGILKLAAITSVSTVLWAVVPMVGWLLGIVSIIVLLAVLFELEPMEIVWFFIVLMLLRLFVFGAIIAAMA